MFDDGRWAECKIRYYAESGATPGRLLQIMVEQRAELALGHVTLMVCFLNGAAVWIKTADGARYEYVSEPPGFEFQFVHMRKELLTKPRPVMWLAGSGSPGDSRIIKRGLVSRASTT